MTELCNGTLHDLVINKDSTLDLTPDRLKNVVLRQIVEGVKHLHENGIIHRDLKPRNILYRIISDEGGKRQVVMKLADFGCSRSGMGDMNHYTRTTTDSGYSQRFRPFGTDGWLAPEVLNGVTHSRPPQAVDIYPLGLIFAFTLCGGRHPYGEDEIKRDERMKNKRSMLDVIQQQLIDEHEERCFYFIFWMLDPNPETRPTAARILDDDYFSGHIVRDAKVCFIIYLLIFLSTNLYNEV